MSQGWLAGIKDESTRYERNLFFRAADFETLFYLWLRRKIFIKQSFASGTLIGLREEAIGGHQGRFLSKMILLIRKPGKHTIGSVCSGILVSLRLNRSTPLSQTVTNC